MKLVMKRKLAGVKTLALSDSFARVMKSIEAENRCGAGREEIWL